MTEAQQVRAHRVERGDRVAAARIYSRFRDHDYAGWVLAGTNACGDYDFVIQSFAAHREAAFKAGQEAKLESAGEPAAMTDAEQEALYDEIHLEELQNGGRT